MIVRQWIPNDEGDAHLRVKSVSKVVGDFENQPVFPRFEKHAGR